MPNNSVFADRGSCNNLSKKKMGRIALISSEVLLDVAFLILLVYTLFYLHNNIQILKNQ